MIIHYDDQDNSTDMGEDLSVPGEPLSSFCGINMMMMKMMRKVMRMVIKQSLSGVGIFIM